MSQNKAMTVNKLMLKLFLFLFALFSQSGFVYVMIVNPILITPMSICFATSAAILGWAVFVLSGGFKQAQGWIAKEMMKAAQRRQYRAAVKEEIRKRMSR